MSARFEVLAQRPTPMGVISLRRRRDPASDEDVYEVKLDDDFLMSSLFTVAEVELARLGLAELRTGAWAGTRPDVLVGGLGLGFTAHEVLADPQVGSLVVVEALDEVIQWHVAGLVPGGRRLAADPRCRLVNGDFFAVVDGAGPGPGGPDERFHVVLVDIDHSPRHLLDPSHARFYEPPGARRLAERLRPGGVFALWSNDPPDDDYLAVLAQVFPQVRAHVVRFANPLQGRDATNTVYVARTDLG